MDITIGKYTLETLTSGMYDSPKDFYREYIQNCVDSIDNAIEMNVISQEESNVEIVISKTDSKIVILDNGTGISTQKALKLILDIGNSSKRNTRERGFRGIGRLAGLAYCGTLSFETSAIGEDKKTIIVFDGNRLRKQLSNSDYDIDLQMIMANIVETKTEPDKKSNHYFKVTMENVSDIDNILDFSSVCDYLSQIAPAKFSEEYRWGKMINAKMSHSGVDIASYNIKVSDDEQKKLIRKSYADSFISDRLRKVQDSILDIEIVRFEFENELLGVLWYAKTNCFGTVNDVKTKGIRMRKGNIQLGARNTLNNIFKDDRFNGWLIGELHIVSNRLIPNARRDGLEKNDCYDILLSQLCEWANNVSNDIRKISIARNKDKKILEAIKHENVNQEQVAVLEASVEPEIAVSLKSENEDVVHSEIINMIDTMLLNRNACTKYKALNVQSDITIDQKVILEKVFDIICLTDTTVADKMVANIIRGFAIK